MQDSKVNRMLMCNELSKIEAVVSALFDPSPKDALEALSIEVKFDVAMKNLWDLT